MAQQEEHWSGTWWKPEEPDVKVPGRLTAAADGDLTLELIGGFDLSRTGSDGSVTIYRGHEDLPVIFGDAAGQAITLFDCFATRTEGAMFGIGHPTRQLVHASQGLHGAHLDDLSETVFERVEFRIENLTAWMQRPAFDFPADVGPGGQTARALEREHVELEWSGWRVSVNQRSAGFFRDSNRDMVSVSADRYTWVVATPPAPVELAAFNSITLALMDFVTLAVGHASGLIHETVIPVLKRQIEYADGVNDEDIPVRVLGRRVVVADPQADVVDQRDWLFTGGDVDLAPALASWLQLDEDARSASRVLFGTFYGRPTYTETRLLLLAIAAESLHDKLFPSGHPLPAEEFKAVRARALEGLEGDLKNRVSGMLQNRPTFLERMLELADTISSELTSLIVGDVPQWARQLRDARNGLAHEGDSSKGTAHMFWLAHATALFLRVVFATRIGVLESVMRRAVEREVRSRPSDWLGDRTTGR